MAGRRWTTPRGPESRFPLNKENVNKFLWYSGACYCRHNTRQRYNHCHILHNFSFAKRSSAYSVNGTDSRSVLNPVASRQCSPSQSSHHTDVPWSHDNCISLMELPPHSPELAPFDFWLFPKIKSAFTGKPFSRIQDLGKAVHSEMRAIPASEYRQSFRSEGCSAGSLRPWDKGDGGGGGLGHPQP